MQSHLILRTSLWTRQHLCELDTLLLLSSNRWWNWGVENSKHLPSKTQLWSKSWTWTHLSLTPDSLFLTTVLSNLPLCSFHLLCKLCFINITDYNRENVCTLVLWPCTVPRKSIFSFSYWMKINQPALSVIRK